jgi:hypothetical protein
MDDARPWISESTALPLDAVVGRLIIERPGIGMLQVRSPQDRRRACPRINSPTPP